MSERGSFVTGYCYCEKCFEVLKKHLLDKEKYLCSCQIPSWCDQPLPIIAGKIGGSYSGEEWTTLEFVIGPEIAKEICHKVVIAVIPDSREPGILTIEPLTEGGKAADCCTVVSLPANERCQK